MMGAAGFDSGLVRRIHEEDALVRQPFFWSAAGMKLFGDHPDLKVSRVRAVGTVYACSSSATTQTSR
jgi:hypothetical protein